jgi:Uncharacterized protein conserved in bacteria (DUF2147)
VNAQPLSRRDDIDYILHQVAIVLTGYAIIRLPLGIGAKFALILAASMSSSLYNPEESLRERPLVGLQVLTGPTREPSSDVWSDGRIYDPGSGKTYRCQAHLDGPDRLELRGYVGIPLIGRTTHWLREGTEGRTCQQRPAAPHEATASVNQ